MFFQKLRFYFRSVRTDDIDQAIAEVTEPDDWTFVLWLCNRHLQKNPQSVSTVLTRARCYQALNRPQAFREEAALAYALDDTFVPAIYHHASVLVDDSKTEQALELLAVIKDHPAVRDGVNALLAILCMRQARTSLAREYQLRAWMANLDDLRFANSYLFGLTYAEVDESDVSREHQFWAQTLLPRPALPEQQRDTILARVRKKLGPAGRVACKTASLSNQRIRIGYWGGDFKEHSVRYFFRPLIEAQDRERFEVFVYDENFMHGLPDQHTHAIKTHSDHFFDISELNDDEVVVLVESHALDILVDLQGHTSANRLHLWQKHLAPLQITGLAYPPTTGLSSIDYKLVDVHMLNGSSSNYYTERQLVLPRSFWCFDPKEDAPFAVRSPHHSNGYVTLGCWGNSAKITPTMMRAWGEILRSSPTARLLVISHSFGDSVTENAFRDLMHNSGVPMEQLHCRKSVPRDMLWSEYQNVDLMLDTFPFNGGTTTCWATYAGVPILTLSGKSLVSCMGKSVMNNLDAPNFVVTDIDQYVRRAIQLIQDPTPIDAFRASAREKFKSSSLGDGKRFASDFEAMCLQILANPDERRAEVPRPNVPALELEEMLRRARMVSYHGNADACDRILRLCRSHYGQDKRILEYEAEALLVRRELERLERTCALESDQTPFIWHILAQSALARGQELAAKEFVRRILEVSFEPETEKPHTGQSLYLQQRLWRAWLTVHTQEIPQINTKTTQLSDVQLVRPCIRVLVVGRDLQKCQSRAQALQELWHSHRDQLQMETCLFEDRVEQINGFMKQKTTADEVIVVLREHVEIVNPNFLAEIVHCLNEADIVSPGGALRWVQKDWTQDSPIFKSWGLMRPSHLSENLIELHFAGSDQRLIIPGAKVIDGQIFAFAPSRVGEQLLDETLSEAGYWAEEDWSNRVADRGGRLLIHRQLGILVHPSLETVSLQTTTGQQRLLSRLGIDQMQMPVEDYRIQTVQVRTIEEGMSISARYLS